MCKNHFLVGMSVFVTDPQTKKVQKAQIISVASDEKMFTLLSASGDTIQSDEENIELIPKS